MKHEMNPSPMDNPDSHNLAQPSSASVPELRPMLRGSSDAAKDGGFSVPRSDRLSPMLRPALPLRDSIPQKPEAPAEAPLRDHPEPAAPRAYASPRTVPMSPSGTMAWEVMETPGGNLYLPSGSEANADVAALLQSDDRGWLVARGESGGKVYLPTDESQDNLVIKDFPTELPWEKALVVRLLDPQGSVKLSDHFGGLPSLRLNVMLAEGLEQVPQDDKPWRIRGAKVLGALLAADASAPDAQPNRWVMERVRPVAHSYLRVPDSETGKRHSTVRGILLGHIMDRYVSPVASMTERKALYDQALEVANGGPIGGGNDPNYDDLPANLLLERLPSKERGQIVEQGIAVKIDAAAHRGFNY